LHKTVFAIPARRGVVPGHGGRLASPNIWCRFFAPGTRWSIWGGESPIGAVFRPRAPGAAPASCPISLGLYRRDGVGRQGPDPRLTKNRPSSTANANYIAQTAFDACFPGPLQGPRWDFVAHECHPSMCASLKVWTVEDVAKRLMDYGFSPRRNRPRFGPRHP